MKLAEYQKLAEVEDRMWYFRALHRHVRRELAAALPLPDAEVLDAGCGTGGLIRRLMAQVPGWQWTGIDLEPMAIELAQSRAGSGVSLVHGNLEAMPLPDEAFDAVVSLDVLYHVDDDAAALREFWRVLRPGGVVVINVPAYRWLWSYHDEAVQSRRRYGRGEVLEKLRQAGFVVRRSTYWNTLLFPLIALRRKLLPAPRGGSDVHAFPPAVERVFDAAMTGERWWLSAGLSLPYGSSILVTAHKPGAEVGIGLPSADCGRSGGKAAD